MRPRYIALAVVAGSMLCAAANAQDAGAAAPSAAPQGNLTLPLKAVVFAPFSVGAPAPAPELLRMVPAALEIGGRRVDGRTAAFDAASRSVDLAPFTGPDVKTVAWVFLQLVCDKTGPVTFGFGADWWYEAHLDGKLISETVSRGDKGNEAWPPSARDFTATVEVAKGEHVLALRVIRGAGSALLAVGGPDDLRNPALRKAPVKAKPDVTRAAFREGPPAGRKWRLVWHDEFDGTALDTGQWNRPPIAGWAWPGIQTSPQPENMFLDGKGALVVRLSRDPDGTVRHGGNLTSKFAKAYGYFETRVQFTRQPGWWGAVWLSGVPYEDGADAFSSPQEFDIFEDFYKPKVENDMSHCYHCSAVLAFLGDQGNAKGVGEGGIIESRKLGRASSGRKVILEQYEGWHTVGLQWTPLEHIFYVDGQETFRHNYRQVPVTNVPLHFWISACLRTPRDTDAKPFYGRLEEAQLPDSLIVDYVRVYEENLGGRRPPRVTLALASKPPFKEGDKIAFDVSAKARGAKLKSLMLFSMGRVRAEQKLDSASVQTTFAVDNLFPLERNTIIAMAQDDHGLVGMSEPVVVELVSSREYTGTAYQGRPQQIPGTLQAGCYDEGGDGVAWRSHKTARDFDWCNYRKEELGLLPEAVSVDRDFVRWVCYEVEVAAEGEYEAELFMNRPDYYTKVLPAEAADRMEPLRLHLVRDGARELLAEWKLPATWNSGQIWRREQKSLGTQTVRLPAGRHKLVFDASALVGVGGEHFCKMVFRPAPKP